MFLYFLTTIACSNKKFRISQEEKQRVLSSKTVFNPRVLSETSQALAEGPNGTASGSVGGSMNSESPSGAVSGSNSQSSTIPGGTGPAGSHTGSISGGTNNQNNSGSVAGGSTSSNNIGAVSGGLNQGTNPTGSNAGTVGGGSDSPTNSQRPTLSDLFGTLLGQISSGGGATPTNPSNSSNSGGNVSGGSSPQVFSTTNNLRPQNAQIGGSSIFGPNLSVGGGTNSIPIKYLCSDLQTDNAKGNVKTSTQPLTLTITDLDTHQVLCRITDGKIKDMILNERRLYFPENCRPQNPHSTLQVTLAETAGQNFAWNVTFLNDSRFVGYWGSRTVPYSDPVKDQGDYYLYILMDRFDGPESQCDMRASPLFVDMGQNDTLTLSPPTKGIYFDILGRNSSPQAHSKKKISWFKNSNFMFLVNPSRSGKVNGIDQMFGDNTFGPDQDFAANGFEALAKYDKNHDGYIDSLDPIFKKLRLWADHNGDGLAEPGELFYLDYMNVEVIDLGYDRDYYEKDIYGNEIKFKSVVKFKNGAIKMMFDLWFRVL